MFNTPEVAINYSSERNINEINMCVRQTLNVYNFTFAFYLFEV